MLSKDELIAECEKIPEFNKFFEGFVLEIRKWPTSDKAMFLEMLDESHNIFSAMCAQSGVLLTHTAFACTTVLVRICMDVSRENGKSVAYSHLVQFLKSVVVEEILRGPNQETSA